MWRPPSSTLFPYTTLFRSHLEGAEEAEVVLDLELGGQGHVDRGAATPLDEVFDGRPAEAVHRERARRIEGLTRGRRSEEHTSELLSRLHLVCRLLLEKKNK